MKRIVIVALKMLFFVMQVSAVVVIFGALISSWVAPAQQALPKPAYTQSGQSAPFGNMIPRDTNSLLKYSRSDGRLVFEIRADGFVQFGDGVTPREAAAFAATLTNMDNLCTKQPDSSTFTYTLMIMSTRQKEFHIGLTTDGRVEYFNFNPTPQAAEFFQLLADHFACDKK